MAKTTKTDAVWTTVDVATLPTDTKAKYDAYKAAYLAMKDARNEFEQQMSAVIAPLTGKRVIFGYNFGKLSIAIVDGQVAKPKAAASTQSLSDWIKAQRDANRNV